MLTCGLGVLASLAQGWGDSDRVAEHLRAPRAQKLSRAQLEVPLRRDTPILHDLEQSSPHHECSPPKRRETWIV